MNSIKTVYEDEFVRVSLDGVGKLIILNRAGDGAIKVTVEGEDNMMYVTSHTHTHGTRLDIGVYKGCPAVLVNR